MDAHDIAEYYRDNYRLLRAIAHRIAGTLMDPEDILSEAIVAVLTQWSQGNGPRESPTSYLAQTMRNRIKDELRSPRSRVGALDDVSELVATEDPRLTDIDDAQERAIIRDVLLLLPTDQREVLIAIDVHGYKPRELTQRFDRPAPAIYSLIQRARTNFRRRMTELIGE